MKKTYIKPEALKRAMLAFYCRRVHFEGLRLRTALFDCVAN